MAEEGLVGLLDGEIVDDETLAERASDEPIAWRVRALLDLLYEIDGIARIEKGLVGDLRIAETVHGVLGGVDSPLRSAGLSSIADRESSRR